MTPEEVYTPVAEFYNSVASEYLERVQHEAHSAFPTIVPKILGEHGINQSDYNVIDLACGAGFLKTYTKFNSYIGVDVAEEMLGEASNNGYDMLIQNDISTVLAGLGDAVVDGAFLMSAAYFLSPHVLSETIIQMRRVANKFICFTFDGVTPALIKEYKNNGGIDVYNHIGFPLPEGIERFTASGWTADTGEEIQVEYCFGLLQ